MIMIVVCPTCDDLVTAREDASCVEPTPYHLHNGSPCSGINRVGFVFPDNDPWVENRKKENHETRISAFT
jgi:hypothetical protein